MGEDRVKRVGRGSEREEIPVYWRLEIRMRREIGKRGIMALDFVFVEAVDEVGAGADGDGHHG